jgi:hypothetical protein
MIKQKKTTLVDAMQIFGYGIFYTKLNTAKIQPVNQPLKAVGIKHQNDEISEWYRDNL